MFRRCSFCDLAVKCVVDHKLSFCNSREKLCKQIDTRQAELVYSVVDRPISKEEIFEVQDEIQINHGQIKLAVERRRIKYPKSSHEFVSTVKLIHGQIFKSEKLPHWGKFREDF